MVRQHQLAVNAAYGDCGPQVDSLYYPSSSDDDEIDLGGFSGEAGTEFGGFSQFAGAKAGPADEFDKVRSGYLAVTGAKAGSADEYDKVRSAQCGYPVGARFSPDGLPLYPLAGEEVFEYCAVLAGCFGP